MNNQTIISRIENVLPNPLVVDNKNYILKWKIRTDNTIEIFYHKEYDEDFIIIYSLFYLYQHDLTTNQIIDDVNEQIDRFYKSKMNKSTIEENSFTKELTELLNRYSKENDSNTPDFILANYLISCLETYNSTIKDREKYYGR